MLSRKHFIQRAAIGIGASLNLPLLSNASAVPPAPFKKNQNLLPIGIAGYTFNKFDLEKSIAMMKRLDIRNISVKDFHLPLNSNEEKIKSVLSQFADANIKVYTVGVIYMKTKEAVDQAFDYAKRVGVNMIVGVPNYELLDYTEEKVKAMNIKIAIHNHGPEDALYPGPQQVWDRIKNKDSRMGLCLDIGHAHRAGVDLVKAIKDYKSRMFDLHIKDVSSGNKEGKAMEIGRGTIDFEAVANALYKINYNGICSIEFEKDMSDPMPGIAESTGYFRGILASHG